MNITNIEKSIKEIKQMIDEKGIRLNPKLSREEVESFKAEYNTKLPLEYEMFLTEIGDGWKWTENEQFATVKMNQLRAGFERPCNIGKIFPFTEGWVWEDDNDEEIFPKEESESDLEYEKRISDLIASTAYGTLTLIEAGWNLILNGPSEGEIWFICGEGMAPCNPRLTFLEFVKKWLEGKNEITDFIP